MKDLLKAMLKILEKDQLGFTDVKSVCIYEDGTVNISHCAESPKRTIDVELENIDEAISYVKSY